MSDPGPAPAHSKGASLGSLASNTTETFATRIGLAVVRPRAAFVVASDRRHAGRAGSDLVLAIAIMLVATQLRWLVYAAWLGAAVSSGLGVRAFVHVLSRTLTIDLGMLVLGAGIVWFTGGPRRELGRAFDLACVVALPLVLVQLAAQTVVDQFSLPTPTAVRAIIDFLAYAWMAGLLTLAIVSSRRALPEPTPQVRKAGRDAGRIVAVIAAAGLAVQVVWIGTHIDQVRPLVPGALAPPLDLPTIGAGGALGRHVSITPGKTTVIDFWATWCGPCVKAMPTLDAIARKHPEIDVIAINLDDPAEARALFDEAHYMLTLVADDGVTSERYGVTVIPHTVVIDHEGTLRRVGRGGIDLEAEIKALAH